MPFPIDGLGSQQSLVLSRNHRFLFAVNAGSNSISSFRVFAGEGIRLVSKVSSGGVFPVSLTVDDHLLYVLNAGGQGNIQGFTVDGDGVLTSLVGAHRNLGATVTALLPTEVLTSPAQVAFTPDGNKLVVTVKGVPPSGGNIIVFSIDNDGLPFQKVVTNLTPSNGLAPFGFVFDKRGHLIVTDALSDAVSSYAIKANNHLTQLSGPVGTGAFAPCWIAQSGPLSYVGTIGGNAPPPFLSQEARGSFLASLLTKTATSPARAWMSSCPLPRLIITPLT